MPTISGPGNELPQLYTRREATQLLRISLRLLDQLLADGQLRPVRFGTGRGRVLIELSEINRYISSRRQDPIREQREVIQKIMGSV